jgi:hypothetical protein
MEIRFLVALMLVLCPLLSARDADSLRGLKALYVLVERLGPAEEAAGITDGSLKTGLELRLRRAGITVSDDPALPCVYLNVHIGSSKNMAAYYYSFHISFKQAVVLERDQTISTVATTWSTGGIGIASPGRIRSAILGGHPKPANGGHLKTGQ